MDGTTWLKGCKSSVLELRWGAFHPHQAIRCHHAFRACWWSWSASPALLVSGVDYSGAKSGFSLNTAAHWSGNSGCDCGKPTVYRGLVEWVLHVNLMVCRRIIAVEFSITVMQISCSFFLPVLAFSRTVCLPQCVYGMYISSKIW